jgi:hypothetical protein
MAGCAPFAALLGLILLIALLFPVLAIAAGVIMEISAANSDAAVRAYLAAPPCPVAQTAADCYRLERGTITARRVRRGKGGDTTDMTIQLPEGSRSTWVKTSWAGEDALQVGTPVTGTVYHDKIAIIALPGFQLTARDNPIREQNDLRLGGLVLVGAGVVFAGIYGYAWWSSKRKRPAGYIDPSLPRDVQAQALRQQFGLAPGSAPAVPHSVSVALPYTLRPQPAANARPWWISRIVAMVMFPMLAFRYRAPNLVVLLTVVLSAGLAVAIVVIHWLYTRNRRLVVDDINVSRFDMWSRPTVVPRTEIQRLALRTIPAGALSRLADERRLLMVGSDGRARLSIPKYNLSYEQASHLAAILRVPIDSSWDRRAGRRELTREIPDSTTWYERHLVSTTIVATIALLALAALFVWAINGFG